MNKTPLNELATNRSAYRRRPRADRGKVHKLQVSPEYWAYLSRHKRGRKLTERAVLELLSQGCAICPHEASLVRQGKPYCHECDKVVGIAGEAKALAWARRVSSHC